MIDSKDWILDSVDIMPLQLSSSLKVKLVFKKMREKLPLSSRWQRLEFYWKLSKKQPLVQGEYYILSFDEDLVCQGFKLQ